MPASRSSVELIVRLAIMMFLQFFIWGSSYVSMDGFLGEMGMKPGEDDLFSFHAAAYTVAPLAAIFAPLTLGLIADRFFNTERVLGVLNLLGAVLLWFTPALAAAGTPDSWIGQFFHPMILMLLLYMICLLYTSPSPRDQRGSRMPSSA